MLTPVKTKTANYTLLEGDFRVRGDATGGAFTLTLPNVDVDRGYILRKVDASVNAVEVAAPGGGSIDGVASIFLTSQEDVVWVVSLGGGVYETITRSIAALASGSLTPAELLNFTGTPTDEGASALVLVPGLTYTLVLASQRGVIIDVEGSLAPSPSGNGINGQLAIHIDGSVNAYFIGPAYDVTTIYGETSAPVTAHKAITLAAGTWHIAVYFRRAPGASGGKIGRLWNDAQHPTKLTVVY